jgi:hypothetical protein
MQWTTKLSVTEHILSCCYGKYQTTAQSTIHFSHCLAEESMQIRSDLSRCFFPFLHCTSSLLSIPSCLSSILQLSVPHNTSWWIRNDEFTVPRNWRRERVQDQRFVERSFVVSVAGILQVMKWQDSHGYVHIKILCYQHVPLLTQYRYQHVPLPTQYCYQHVPLPTQYRYQHVPLLTQYCYQHVHLLSQYFVIDMSLCSQNTVINMCICPHNTLLSTCPFAHTVLLSTCPFAHTILVWTCPFAYTILLSTWPFVHTILCNQHVQLPTQYSVINISFCPHNTLLLHVQLPTQYSVINMSLCPHNTL